ncbi:SWIB-domain-containing protein [Amylocystis lapponica]|nr:SWIB-domain-containing protein [Amylocystis lapponica]
MAASINILQPKIRAILTAPGTDLSTISAKRVRKQLLEVDKTVSAEFLKENKSDIDALIARIYEEVSGGTGETDAPEQRADEKKKAKASSSKRKRKDSEEEDFMEEDEGDEEESATPPPKARKSRKSEVEMTDAELARQLSNEINGRPRSSRSSVAKSTKGKANGAKRGGKREKKSAAIVESDGDDDESDEDGRKKKKKKTRRGGLQKEYILSEPLSALLNVDKLSRPQVVKKLWEHIRESDLQNPEDRREIICDDKMRAIFSVDRLDMFRMNKLLGQHLHEP